jgi:hypothetical protein
VRERQDWKVPDFKVTEPTSSLCLRLHILDKLQATGFCLFFHFIDPTWSSEPLPPPTEASFSLLSSFLTFCNLPLSSMCPCQSQPNQLDSVTDTFNLCSLPWVLHMPNDSALSVLSGSLISSHPLFLAGLCLVAFCHLVSLLGLVCLS